MDMYQKAIGHLVIKLPQLVRDTNLIKMKVKQVRSMQFLGKNILISAHYIHRNVLGFIFKNPVKCRAS